MNTTNETAKWEFLRRVRKDVAEEGEISSNGVLHHASMVGDAFGVSDRMLISALPPHLKIAAGGAL